MFGSPSNQLYSVLTALRDTVIVPYSTLENGVITILVIMLLHVLIKMKNVESLREPLYFTKIPLFFRSDTDH